MTDQNKTNKFFQESRNQRFIYGIGLLLWIILWYDEIQFINQETLLIYSLQTIIPGLLLIGQLFLNDKKIWKVLVVYISLYSLWILRNMFFDLQDDFYRKYLSQPIWTYERMRDYTILLLILFSINWTIWKIKPVKNK